MNSALLYTKWSYQCAAASLPWALSFSLLLFFILVCGGCPDSAPVNNPYARVGHMGRGIYRQSPVGKIGLRCWTPLWGALRCISRCAALHPSSMPPKTAWKFGDISQEMAQPFSQQTPGRWAVYFSRHLGKGEEIPSSTSAVSCGSGLSCKFVPSPAELNAAAAALRAGLLCCHVNCACHLFTFDLAEHFMIRTKASSDFELGGGWVGARRDEERGRASAPTFCRLPSKRAGEAAWGLVSVVSFQESRSRGNKCSFSY